jgi:predicted dehydrogenase
MVAAFDARRLPLYVAYYRRGLPRFVKAKQIIDSGAMGVLKTVEYRYSDGQMRTRLNPVPWRLKAEIAGGGFFLDLASHALDLLDWLAGPLMYVQGTASNVARQYDVEDRVEMTFSTPANVPGSARWYFSDDKRTDEFRFAGNLGELRFSCFGGEPVRVRHINGREEAFDLPNPPHVGQPLIQMIVEELRNPAGPIKSPTTGASALRTQIVMDQALQSYYGGREDGFWNRPWANA